MFSPCKGCTKRVFSCHSSCEDYKSFRQERLKINEATKINCILNAIDGRRLMKERYSK